MVEMTIPYGLIGDSSLLCTNGKKKKAKRNSFVGRTVEKILGTKIVERPYCGGGVKNFIENLSGDRFYETLGISYFGNEHPKVAMSRDRNRLQQHYSQWQQLFALLRQKVGRVVFWMGGYAAKFSTCSPAYDENLATIRQWISDAGFEVQTHFGFVADLSLGDAEHWHLDELDRVSELWATMLRVPAEELLDASSSSSVSPEAAKSESDVVQSDVTTTATSPPCRRWRRRPPSPQPVRRWSRTLPHPRPRPIHRWNRLKEHVAVKAAETPEDQDRKKFSEDHVHDDHGDPPCRDWQPNHWHNLGTDRQSWCHDRWQHAWEEIQIVQHQLEENHHGEWQSQRQESHEQQAWKGHDSRWQPPRQVHSWWQKPWSEHSDVEWNGRKYRSEWSDWQSDWKDRTDWSNWH